MGVFLTDPAQEFVTYPVRVVVTEAASILELLKDIAHALVRVY